MTVLWRSLLGGYFIYEQEGTRTLDMRPFGYLATIPATISTRIFLQK